MLTADQASELTAAQHAAAARFKERIDTISARAKAAQANFDQAAAPLREAIKALERVARAEIDRCQADADAAIAAMHADLEAIENQVKELADNGGCPTST